MESDSDPHWRGVPWTAGTDVGKTGKVIHFIRHGEGYHNLAVRERGTVEEYKSWEWYDSRLTPLGERQARALTPVTADLPIDIVFVSSLSRAIQTGLLAIERDVPFVSLECIRERIGTHPCDKHRPRSELEADFPRVDFSGVAEGDDVMWSEAREPWHCLTQRANTFLDDVMSGSHQHVACVAHNDFFQALFGHGNWALPEEMRGVRFQNCQLLSVAVTPAE